MFVQISCQEKNPISSVQIRENQNTKHWVGITRHHNLGRKTFFKENGIWVEFAYDGFGAIAEVHLSALN